MLKKFAALLVLLMAIGWAVYIYGFVGTADATFAPEPAYQLDPKLPQLVRQLDSLGASLRAQLEIIEHAEKKQAEEPAGTPPAKLLRDPFSPTP